MRKPYYLLLALVFLAQAIIAQPGTPTSRSSALENENAEKRIYLATTQASFHKLKSSTSASADLWIKAKYPDGTYVLSLSPKQAKALKREYPNIWLDSFSAQKLDSKLPTTGTTDVAISFLEPISAKDRTDIMEMYGIQENQWSIKHPQWLMGRVDAALVEAIAALPEVAFINLMEDDAQPLGEPSRAFHHAGLAQYNPDSHLRGKGMVVGVGDGGELGNHIDFEERVINYASGTYSSYGDHGDKTAGLIAGGGHIKESYHGYAPEAKLLTQKTFRVFYYLDQYYGPHGMRLTNNSYGSSFNCSYNGRYDYYSSMMDGQINEYGDILHIVAAGNNGSSACGAFPTGYNTVLRTYATAKNVLTVGAVNQDGSRAGFSAAGPVMDGRIKPEIMTLAEGVQSTSNNYNYAGAGGTSGAAANATGATTLLYEHYKKTNNGHHPQGALLKALICNTADDGGESGPDFLYGFGILNLGKAIKAVDRAAHEYGTLQSTGQEVSHTFTVPAGQSEFRVMLAWSDIPQPVTGADALMNDLDLMVVAPDGTKFWPWILDPSPAQVSNAATRGEDHTNVLEQVTLSFPQPGTYTIKVKAHALQSSKQDYALSYWAEAPGLDITYPAAGTSFLPDAPAYISWDANLQGETGYHIEVSTDNGQTWQDVATTNGESRFFKWDNPGIQAENALIKITGSSTGMEAISAPFHLLPRPSNFSVSEECGSSLTMQWDTVTDALAYEVFMLRGSSMEKIAELTDTAYRYMERFDPGDTYWFAVRAKFPNGGSSLRADAKPVTPAGLYPCPWNGDVEIAAMDSPEKGRAYTSLSLSDSERLEITLFNAGQDTLTGITLDIQLNGSSSTEVISGTLLPGDSLTHTSTQSFNLSAPGEYIWNVTANLPTDNHLERNTWGSQSMQLDNPLISLPSSDNMDSHNAEEVRDSTFGIIGFETMDFYTTNSTGSATFVETGAPRNQVLHLSNRSTTLASEAIFTKNLPQNQTVFLRLDYRVSGSDGNVSLATRATDTDEWLELELLQTDGEWLDEPKIINLTDSLSQLGKVVSPSTQLRLLLTGNVEMDLDELAFAGSADEFLPVEMLYFRGKKIGENVQLEWATASEENNDRFEVELARGKTALQRGEWEVLGMVQGKGSTVEESLYHFIDTENGKTGERYYRLRQVDFDGAFEYSEVVLVKFNGGDLEDMNLYPNPVRIGDLPKVQFSLSAAQRVRFTMVDATGKICYIRQVELDRGFHDLPVELENTLSPGVYYFSAHLENGQVHKVKIAKIQD